MGWMSIIFYHIGKWGLFNPILSLKGFSIDKICKDRCAINCALLMELLQRRKCQRKMLTLKHKSPKDFSTSNIFCKKCCWQVELFNPCQYSFSLKKKIFSSCQSDLLKQVRRKNKELYHPLDWFTQQIGVMQARSNLILHLWPTSPFHGKQDMHVKLNIYVYIFASNCPSLPHNWQPLVYCIYFCKAKWLFYIQLFHLYILHPISYSASLTGIIKLYSSFDFHRDYMQNKSY